MDLGKQDAIDNADADNTSETSNSTQMNNGYIIIIEILINHSEVQCENICAGSNRVWSSAQAERCESCPSVLLF